MSGLAPLEAMPEGVRAYACEDLHLTLAFLGACPEAAAHRAWDHLEAAALEPTTIDAHRAALLGGRNPTAMAAVLGVGRAELEGAIKTHRPALLAAAGRPPDDRPSRPHVTFARIRRKATALERTQAEAWVLGLQLELKTSLDRIALYTWAEDRSTRRFRRVRTRVFEHPR